MSEFSELVSGGARLDRSPLPAWLAQNLSPGVLFCSCPCKLAPGRGGPLT